MTSPIGKRRRLSGSTREAERLTASISASLGRAVHEARRRRRLSQARLADRVHVHQSSISRIELGRGGSVPLDLWVALGVALDQPLAISFSRPLGAMREPVDAGPLAMQERLLELARATGRTAMIELPTRPADPRHSIDVCVRDVRRRVLIIHEVWNTFGDLGAAMRSTNRKVAEAVSLAATFDDGPEYRVASVWVVRSSAANRTLVSRHPQVFGSGFPGSSRAWVRSLLAGFGAANPPWLGLARFRQWPAH